MGGVRPPGSLTVHRAVRRMLERRAARREQTAPDATTDAVLSRIVAAHHAGRAASAEHAPATVDA
jgi:hypothetical protein